jgi:hypothetical protein
MLLEHRSTFVQSLHPFFHSLTSYERPLHLLRARPCHFPPTSMPCPQSLPNKLKPTPDVLGGIFATVDTLVHQFGTQVNNGKLQRLLGHEALLPKRWFSLVRAAPTNNFRAKMGGCRILQVLSPLSIRTLSLFPLYSGPDPFDSRCTLHKRLQEECLIQTRLSNKPYGQMSLVHSAHP